MKLSLCITFRFIIVLIIVLGLATFLSPANSAPAAKKVKDGVKIEKQYSNAVNENGDELLHGEIFLKF